MSRPALEITKTHALSPVHRREPMNVCSRGTARLLGLFTTRAYAEPASSTPLLRDKLRRILDAEDLIDGSHDSKAAIALFDGYPKGELFAAPVEDLRAQLSVLLALRADEVRLLGRRSPDGRGASLVATLPRERYGATLRERLRGMVASRLRDRPRRAARGLRRGRPRLPAPDGALGRRAAGGRRRPTWSGG